MAVERRPARDAGTRPRHLNQPRPGPRMRPGRSGRGNLARRKACRGTRSRWAFSERAPRRWHAGDPGGGRKPAVYRPVLRPHRVPVGAGAFEKPGGNAARGTSRTRTTWTLRFSYAQHAQPADGREPVREGAPVAAAQARAYVLRPRGSRHVSGAVPRQHS